MKPFTVAIIGCGNISRMHFEASLPHPERIQVVAVCDAETERVEEICRRYKVPHGFPSLGEMIARSAWEIGIVCTPTNVRSPVVETLAAAGKHIFVEKPFADTYREAQTMVTTCEQAGVRIAVNQNFRYHYPFELAHSLVTQGEIGQVVSIAHHDLLFRQDSGWRTQLKRHALSVMGVHWLDGFRRTLSDEAASVVCHTRSSQAIQCVGETDSSAIITFTRGALVSYVESFSALRERTETVVLGETGALVLTYDGLGLFDRDHRSTPRRHWENPYRGSHKPEATFVGFDLFLTALEQGNESANSGRDNLKTIALLDGAYRSAEEGRPVLFDKGVPL
ncbi:MAG TPA: Gfo/Idh/MocA family oxidoreductase [Ktedonosporobacter sp.]|nr:Gfo/Idh/MocA family oxidoreductase [Ktedonosporobacter sp.]